MALLRKIPILAAYAISGTINCSTLYLVQNTRFCNLSQSTAGGAIYFNSNTCDLIIRGSSFISCTTSSSGGAIAAYGYISYQMSFCCGYLCDAKDTGTFACGSDTTTTNTRYVNFTSISKCGASALGSSTLYIIYGIFYISNLNSSFGKVLNYAAGIYVDYPSGLTMQYAIYASTIGMNTISIYSVPSSHTVDTISVVNNTYTSYGLFRFATNNLVISNSVINSNSGSTLLNSGTLYLVLKNCVAGDSTIWANTYVTLDSSCVNSVGATNKVSGTPLSVCLHSAHFTSSIQDNFVSTFIAVSIVFILRE